MLLDVYLCGWLVATVAALIAATQCSDRGMSRPLCVVSLGILVGALWPVLVVGVVELLAIVAFAKGMRIGRSRPSNQAFMERDEELIWT